MGMPFRTLENFLSTATTSPQELLASVMVFEYNAENWSKRVPCTATYTNIPGVGRAVRRKMSEQKGNRREGGHWLSLAVLLVLLVVAFALRWRYVKEISLFVDEFVTAWAARGILSRGLPIFPSGNFYPHGLVLTYLEIPFVLGEFNETLVRIPGLIVSLAGLPVAYWVGRRLFSEQVGLIAAAALAVDPDCIVWGGRARMYGLLQLLTLLVIWAYYRGLVDDRPRDRYLAMGLLVLAIFTHAEAVFLLPVLGLVTVLILPWRRIFRWSVILPFLLAGVGAVAYYLLSKFGQPGHLETLQESRPYLSVASNVLSGPQVFAPVFTRLHRLPFTLLGIAGLYFVFRPRIDRRAPLTYLYVVFVAFVLLIVLLAGATWQRERYLFLVLPLLFLAGGEVLTRLLGLVPALRHPRSWQSAIVAFLVALFIGLAGARSAYVQEWGYDQAFRYLRDRASLDAEDRIVTLMPSGAMLYLGRNDHFAIQRGYEEFVVSRAQDEGPVDLWTATPLMTDTTAFADLLASGSRTWFIVDGWRFQTRYEPDFILTVLDQMDLEYNERGVMVFRGEGYKPLPQPAVEYPRQANFSDELALTGFGLSPVDPASGDELEVTLHWQALDQAGPAYIAFLHLIRPDGTGVVGVDEPVLRGLFQPDLWPKNRAFPDRHHLTLPPDLPPGRYRLDLGLYYPGQPEQRLPVEGKDYFPLASLSVGGAAMQPTPGTPADITYGDQLRLFGYDFDCNQGRASHVTPPAKCIVNLYWQAVRPMDRDYTVFVHLVGGDGAKVTQHDARPGDAFFPTSTWLPGARVFDPHPLDLPAELPPGDYTVLVGIYHPPTAERLQAVDGDGLSLGDAVPLVTVEVGAESP